MKILLDTNVLIDYLGKREPYFHSAQKILSACCFGEIEGCIAAHSITNIFYILRKSFSVDERRTMLKALSQIADVIELDKTKIINALDNKHFEDLEDCLQNECAIAFGADYIVTRNIKDFYSSDINLITPDNFLKLLYK